MVEGPSPTSQPTMEQNRFGSQEQSSSAQEGSNALMAMMRNGQETTEWRRGTQGEEPNEPVSTTGEPG